MWCCHEVNARSEIMAAPAFRLAFGGQRIEIAPLVVPRMSDIIALIERTSRWKPGALDQVQLVLNLTSVGHKCELSTSRPALLWPRHLCPVIIFTAVAGYMFELVAVCELTIFQVEEMLPEFVVKPHRAGSRHYMSMGIVSLK